MLLGALSFGAGFLKRVIDYTEDRTITISTGYITMLLGLVTVVAHNVWVWDWPVIVTLAGWIMTLKGVVYLLFPRILTVVIQDRRMQAAFRVGGVVSIVLGLLVGYDSFFRR